MPEKICTQDFQQRQTEQQRQQRELNQEQAIVEDMAAKFSCSNGIARDFAGQCEERLASLDFDLLCSALALDFWASPPEHARPVVDTLRELADERQRHRDALARLRDRLLGFIRSEATHQHLALPIEHYRHAGTPGTLPGSRVLGWSRFTRNQVTADTPRRAPLPV